MGSIFKLTALAGVAAGAYAAVKKFAPNILPDKNEAEDMAKNRYFSHNSPTYGSAFDMLKNQGISYRTAGENI